MVDQVVDFIPAGPVARAFMLDDSFVRIIVGPVGSGKTSACVAEILRRAMMQAPGPDGVRRVRVVVIRNTYAELMSTTVRSWEQWCPRHFGKFTVGTSPITHRVQIDGLDLEVYFLALDKDEDVKKLLSLEVSFAWIDESKFVPRSIVDALTGRVGRYPSRLQGGCTWSGILLSSNPSDTESWLYKLVENPPEGYAVFRQPPGDGPDAENVGNLPTTYYRRLAAGKDPEWIRVYIKGEFGFTIEGRPVYPGWSDSAHVAKEPIAAIDHLGLVIGADWGLTPAAVIGQVLPDGRINIIDEFIAEDSGIPRFCTNLCAYLRRHYPGHAVTMAVGDPSGTARQGDEQTVFDLANANSFFRWRPARSNDLTLRIESVSDALGRMVGRNPGFQLSPKCSTLRKGFAGGYHFQQIKAGHSQTFDERPRKNAYSHPHDALQYLVMDAGGSERVLNRAQRTANRPRMAEGMDDDLFGDRDSRTTNNSGESGVRWGNRIDRGNRHDPPALARGTHHNALS